MAQISVFPRITPMNFSSSNHPKNRSNLLSPSCNQNFPLRSHSITTNASSKNQLKTRLGNAITCASKRGYRPDEASLANLLDQDLLDAEEDEQTYQARSDLEREEEEQKKKISSEEKEKEKTRSNSKEDGPGYQERLASSQSEIGLPEAIQTGIGELNGLPVALGVLEFQFIAGTMGSVVGEKLTRLIEYATRENLPLIIVCASGGARIHEGSFSLMQMGKISSALYNYQLDSKRFYISILTSPTTGGVTASFGMLGKAIIAEPEATIAFAGKRVIEQTLNIQVPEGVQQTEYLFTKGAFDLIVPRFYLKKLIHLLYVLNGYDNAFA